MIKVTGTHGSQAFPTTPCDGVFCIAALTGVRNNVRALAVYPGR
jgi:hypothetical protein